MMQMHDEQRAYRVAGVATDGNFLTMFCMEAFRFRYLELGICSWSDKASNGRQASFQHFHGVVKQMQVAFLAGPAFFIHVAIWELMDVGRKNGIIIC